MNAIIRSVEGIHGSSHLISCLVLPNCSPLQVGMHHGYTPALGGRPKYTTKCKHNQPSTPPLGHLLHALDVGVHHAVDLGKQRAHLVGRLPDLREATHSSANAALPAAAHRRFAVP